MALLTFVDTHNMIAYLSKSDVSAGFDQIVDFLNAQVIQYALIVNPTIYVLYGKKVVVTEDVIRQDLRLDDVDGVECLPNEEIFTELAHMGYEKPSSKLTTSSVVPWHLLSSALLQVENSTFLTELEQDKYTQTLEIIKLKKRVKKLEKKKKSKSLGLKRLRKGRITQEDVSTVATKDVCATEPIVFDDEEVTMTMAQTLIKMKAEKEGLLDEQIAKRGMTYDNVRTIFEREYKNVQTLFKPDEDVKEPIKKRVAEETLLQEKKDYPLSDVVMILMLSAKLQVDEDYEMVRDLVMKIFMEAKKPKSRSLDTSPSDQDNLKKLNGLLGINYAGLSLNTVGSRLMLLGKAVSAAELAIILNMLKKIRSKGLTVFIEYEMGDEQTIDEVLDDVDTDKDGKINYDDFMNI
nr:calcium-dependent protein kinase 29-like isoform X1 [Tanacetum cinerariifolium]